MARSIHPISTTDEKKLSKIYLIRGQEVMTDVILQFCMKYKQNA